MSNLTKRLLTAVIGIAALFIVLLHFGGLSNSYVINTLLIFLIVECAALIGVSTLWHALLIGVGVGAIHSSDQYLDQLVSPVYALALLAIFFVIPAVALHLNCLPSIEQRKLRSEDESNIRRLSLAVGCVVVLVAFCITLAAIQMLFGMALLISLLVISWSTDSGAYFVGKSIGKRPLAKSISPNKTMEGVWGGYLTGIVVSLLLGFFWLQPYYGWPTVSIALLALITPVLAILGDLDESILKRLVDAKDSAGILPGHGGLLDRIDSLVYTAPVVLLLATIFVEPVT